MKYDLLRYLEKDNELGHVKDQCIEVIWESETESEYLHKIFNLIVANVCEIVEIKQAWLMMEQIIEALQIDGSLLSNPISFYREQSDKIVEELDSKVDDFSDYVDILSLARVDFDTNGDYFKSIDQREYLKRMF